MTHLEAEDNKHLLEFPVLPKATTDKCEFSYPKNLAYSSTNIVTIIYAKPDVEPEVTISGVILEPETETGIS